MNEILALLKEKHGPDFNIKEDVYFLYLKDAMVSVYFDEEEKEMKIDIEMLPENTFVYFSEETSIKSFFEKP